MALGVDHVGLAHRLARVAADEVGQHVGCGLARGHAVGGLDAPERVDEGLGGDRRLAAADVRHQRADGEETAGDGDAEGTGVRVAGDDGPGQLCSFPA